MKARKLGSYKKIGKDNKPYTVFRYAVSGTPEQLAAYEKAQGANFRKDEQSGSPLWFTTRYAGETCDLIITAKGQVIADMSKFDAAASLANQYGGSLGTELAKAAAAQLMGTSPTEDVTTPTEDKAKV